LAQGSRHFDVLEHLLSLAEDETTGNMTFQKIIEEALEDEALQRQPLFHWDCIFTAMDKEINQGTRFGGNSANMPWERRDSRKKGETLSMVATDVIKSYCTRKSYDFNTFDLRTLPDYTFQDIAYKFGECIERDEAFPDRGKFLHKLFHKVFQRYQNTIAMGTSLGGSEQELESCLTGHLMRISVIDLGPDDSEWGRRKELDAKKAVTPSPRVANVQMQPPPPMYTAGPSTVFRQPADPVAQTPAIIPQGAKPTTKHPYGNYSTDRGGKPRDSELSAAKDLAVKRNDQNGVNMVNAVIAAGQAEAKGREAALPPRFSDPAVTPTAPFRPKRSESPATFSAAAREAPTSSQFAPPANYGTQPRRVNPKYGDVPRMTGPPAGSLGNHEGENWNSQLWFKYAVDLDHIKELKDTPAGEVLIKARPFNSEFKELCIGRGPMIADGEKYPIDSCAYCRYRTEARLGSPEHNLDHPNNWRYGTGSGAHPARFCQAFKRWCSEGGEPDTPPDVRLHIQRCCRLQAPRARGTPGTTARS